MVYRPVICFDFERVLINKKDYDCENENVITSPPRIGVKELIKVLARDYKIIMYSKRCETYEGTETVQEWLEHYQITYDDILDFKPPSLVFIDNIYFNDNEYKKEIIEFKRNLDKII